MLQAKKGLLNGLFRRYTTVVSRGTEKVLDTILKFTLLMTQGGDAFDWAVGHIDWD